MRFSVSIKGVLFPKPGQCVLALNDRGEWELPGGRIEIGETPQQCVVREIREELDLQAEVACVLDSYLFEVIRDTHVFIVTYGCVLRGDYHPRLSGEHREIRAFPVHDLPANLPTNYGTSIREWALHPNNSFRPTSPHDTAQPWR